MEPFKRTVVAFKGTEVLHPGALARVDEAALSAVSGCHWQQLITIITTIFSPPPGVRNFGFSICALCLLRDVEKETHKHKVLWEKYKMYNI